ncbi:MAG: GntR family transcriptional regulator [Gammaproteobacteria bacterium]|nr:GntR family transcriptional regulator [Gammaproteobacteria bacterium]MDG2338981.1 GntR family transcriptional regulator [Gammaproteobacteria bacterium]
MNITIDTKDGVPIYRQIANQIRYMVASGILQSGEEISPVRTLALALNVTPNTVVKAYDELNAAGVIFKRRGAGTYISEEQSPIADRERRRIIQLRIDALLAEAHQLDFTADDLLGLIRQRQRLLHQSAQSDKKGTENPDD